MSNQGTIFQPLNVSHLSTLSQMPKIENDEILEEWDVYINTELTSFLHLTPLPSSSLSTRFNTAVSSATRFKPQARRLEMVLSHEDLHAGNLVGERVRELQMDRGQKVVGAGWPWKKVQYLLGQFTPEGELHMTPVESVIPLNACLSHLDDYDARMKASSSSSSISSGTTSRRSHSHEDIQSNNNTSSASASASAAKTIQLQFRKKETEEQVQARLNSFAHLQRQVDDESWINLKHFNPQAQEVMAVRDKLIGTVREPLEFLPNEDYLDKVINQDPQPIHALEP